jgi:hypothetical protein
MKVLRRLMTLLLVLGVIIALGFAWKHSPAASLIADDRGGQPALERPNRPAGNREDRRFSDSDGLNFADVGELAPTLALQTLAFVLVIFVDKRRRQRQPRIRGGASINAG